jgi:DNA-binding MarR family transcriptional regulator
MSTSAETCAELILEMTPRVMRAIRTEVAQYLGSGTTLPQFRVLSHLNRGSQCLSDLAARQHVSLATMSKIVSGLVERGYVERASEGADRRYITLRLTASGRRFFDKVHAHSREQIAARLVALSRAERERIMDGLQILGSAFEETRHSRRGKAAPRTQGKSP